MVLNGGGNQVFAPLAHTLDGAEDGPVVRLGTAGGEEDPVGLCAHGGCDLVPGNPQVSGGVDAKIVQGAGIGPDTF